MADYVYPVLDNHPHMSERYCPMCGGVVDNGGEAANKPVPEWEIAFRMAGMMARLAYYRPQQMRVLACRMVHPEQSLRETAEAVGIGRSRLGEIIDEIERDFPGLGVLLGRHSQAALSQQKRRAGASVPGKKNIRQETSSVKGGG